MKTSLVIIWWGCKISYWEKSIYNNILIGGLMDILAVLNVQLSIDQIFKVGIIMGQILVMYH